VKEKEKKLTSRGRRFSDSEIKSLVQGFQAFTGPKEEFCRAQGVTKTTVYRWIKAGRAEGASRKRKSKGGNPLEGKAGAKPSPEARKEAVEAFLKSGAGYEDFAKIWGVSSKSLRKWRKIYDEKGAQALEFGTYGRGRKRGRKGSSPHLKSQIVLVQKENPSFGLKKVRDFLYRFRGLSASTATVRKVVKEAELPRAPVQPKKRKRSSDKIRRFERAKPMQLWQSDITSFVLTRHSQRVYLTVFMDDHSRYVVAWSLQSRQKSELVIDSLLMGIQRFGKPEEVLTDQGRQYFSWRGKSDFQKLLDKEGIRHVVARSHHPQTLGKCERFWETVGQEFWERAKPQELEETRIRLGHFIAHYNHFRPHQGIDGMTPADRFFGVESEVRKALEATLTQNELRLAVGDQPRTPVFLVGQIGDQPVSLHGESGSLLIQTPNGVVQRLEYSQFGQASSLNTPVSETPVKGNVENVELNSATSDTPTTELQRDDRENNAIEEREKNEDQNAHLSSSSPEIPVGMGNSFPEGASASDGFVSDGILDGASHEKADCRKTESSSDSNLATVTASDLRYGSRTADSTEDALSNEKLVSRSLERSEASSRPDYEIGKAGSDPTTTDRVVERDAELRGHEIDERNSGEIARSSSTSAIGESPVSGRDDLRSECKTSQEGASTESGEENVESDTDGRQP